MDHPKGTPPPARPSVMNAALTRPDWTVSMRNTAGVLALDKNENNDPIFREQLNEILAGLPPEASIEYPDLAAHYHKLARHLVVSAENLLFTHGSDGAIRLVFEAFLSEGETVLATRPTFAMYPIYSMIYGGRLEHLDYESNAFGPTLSVDTVCDAIDTHQPRILCLPNPDSPTGTHFEVDACVRILKKAEAVGSVVIADEAYFPFSDTTVIGQIDTFANLVVTRTFAKAWGIAGLRLGYAAAHPKMMQILHKVRPMYEVNGTALAAMSALIDRYDIVDASVQRTNTGRDYFASEMNKLGFKTFTGSGNFVQVDFDKKRDQVFAALDGKVLYRKSFSEPCLAGFSRFSTAPEDVMRRLVEMITVAVA